MKRILLLVIVLSLKSIDLLGDELLISGVYQGKNLYIQNPSVPGTDDFCTIKAYVNGTEIIRNPTTSAYEIKLSMVNIGETVRVRIVHHDGCKPVVINPQVIRKKDSFKFTRIDLKDNSLGWASQGDIAGDYYYVEKRIGNKWIMIKSLKAKGESLENRYLVGVMNSVGDNKYRIKCIQKGGGISYSPLVTYYSKDDPVTFYPIQAVDKIYLSRIASYEVLDVHGNLMASGNKKEIEVNTLSAGLYYLIIEDKTEKFYKK